MNYIQILTTLVAVFVILSLFFSFKKGTVSAYRFAGWLVLWGGIVILVFYPGLSDRIALFLGIDRGTDAAFFGAILIIFYLLLRLLLRIEGIERDITKLVRHLALGEDEDNSRK